MRTKGSVQVSDESNKPALDAMIDMARRLVELPVDERLFAIEMLWVCEASNRRNEALPFPGGFPTERARQVNHLRKLIQLTEDVEPDLELERLWQEEDHEGALAHLRLLSEATASPYDAESDRRFPAPATNLVTVYVSFWESVEGVGELDCRELQFTRVPSVGEIIATDADSHYRVTEVVHMPIPRETAPYEAEVTAVRYIR
jgi:hypothetical protein